MTDLELMDAIIESPSAAEDARATAAEMKERSAKYDNKVTDKQRTMLRVLYKNTFGDYPPKDGNEPARSGGSGSSSGGLGVLERIEAKLDLLLKERGLEYGKKAQATRESSYASDAAHNEQGPPPRRSAPAAQSGPLPGTEDELPFLPNWA